MLTTRLQHLPQEHLTVDCCFVTREVATITYRSGPEWGQRFGRKRIEDLPEVSPNLCPEFEIESYLDYQVMNSQYKSKSCYHKNHHSTDKGRN